MKSASILVVLLFTTFLFPQEKSFQAEIGLNQSWYNYELDLVNQFKGEFRPQITLGLNYNFYEIGNFAVNAGLRYHNLFKYIDMSPYGYGDGSRSTFDNYLLSVPIQINYNTGIFNTAVLLNIEPSYIIKSKTTTPRVTLPMGFETTDVTSQMNRIQFELGIGLEYTFNIAQEEFGIKSIYNYGLTSVPKKGEFTDQSGTHDWIAFKTTELNFLLTYNF
jgi:Outer membrane protein beta-barrel domain